MKQFIGLLVVSVLIGCFGCSTGKPSGKDDVFYAMLKQTAANMRPGQVMRVPVPDLKETELLVVINGYYRGGIAPSAYVSENLSREITLEYGEKANYIVFVRDQKILSAKGFLDENAGTPMEPLSNNARVAHFGTRNVVIRCVQRKTKPDAALEVWNPQCRLEVEAFE